MSQTRRQHEIKMQTQLVKDGAIITCLSCEMWDNKTNVCKRWNASPPAEVIVVGCEEYEQKIPF